MTRLFIAFASFALCVICLAAIPATAPTFAETFGPLAALFEASVLGACALVMGVQSASFGFARHSQG